MLLTVLMPQARAAERQRSADSIILVGSKFFGTPLAVAMPAQRVTAGSAVAIFRGVIGRTSWAMAVWATATAARRSQLQRMAAVRSGVNRNKCHVFRIECGTGVTDRPPDLPAG